MDRGTMLLAATLLLTCVAPTRSGAQSVEGTWKVSNMVGGTFEQSLVIVQLKTDNGKLTGELLAGAPRTLKSVRQEGNTLQIVLQSGTINMVIEAVVPKEAAKRILGTMITDGTAAPCWLEATAETKLPKNAFRAINCQPMSDARAAANKAVVLRFRAQKVKDAEQKKKLLQEADEAAEAAKTEVPKLYKEVLAKFSDSPVVFEAALGLIRKAQVSAAKADEVKSWAATGIEAAKPYGPRWQAEYTIQLAAALIGQEQLMALALDYARQAERHLTPKASAADQVRVLSLLSRALQKVGKADEAKPLEVHVAKLDEILDREYVAKMPPFKGETFPGRKSKSKRVVFMELFTGAMCPPCVAADLAFDVLQKTYKPSELVLIQYHMHIPGPDPLTNPDTEARWAYYGEAVRGVPASLFNGKARAGGGGGIAQAEKKYEQYRDVIEELLEEKANVKLAAKAVRKGDQIDINVEVTGLANPNPEMKLRILLAEETVRFVGSNKIRMHHNVVRAFPGGVAGQALTAADSKLKAAINLSTLRDQLTKYLDEYQTNVRPFTNPSRPLAFNHLRVIAFVQDDSTQEILQAVQVAVE